MKNAEKYFTKSSFSHTTKQCAHCTAIANYTSNQSQLLLAEL